MSEAHRRKCKDYNYRRHVMGGSTTVPADEAREILTDLAARMSYSAIARALGTSHNYVTSIIRGKTLRISPQRAAEIRKIRLHRPADTSHVSPLGARRRLQALHALGYTWARLEGELGGYSLGAIKCLVHEQVPVIEARNDERIRAAYDRLSMILPTSDVPQERSGIARARNAARRKGWPPPLAWDNIDDPNERPARQEYRPSTRAELLADLDRQGAGISVACEALHVSRDSLQVWCARNGHSKIYRRMTARETAAGRVNQHTMERGGHAA